VGDKHIRVDLDGKQENDFDTSIFIGNLPWVINEEDLRTHFAEAGKILNVRIIRDKDTFIGKGIAYIQFSSPDEMKKALESKNGSTFKGREIRVKRATPSERREKKVNKKRIIKEQMKEQHRENRKSHFHERKHGSKKDSEVATTEGRAEQKELKKIEPFMKNNKKKFDFNTENVDF
jgi:nucleolar protein 12